MTPVPNTIEQAELDEAELVRDPMVVVGVEPDLADVEVLGTVDVGDRDRDELELPVHAVP